MNKYDKKFAQMDKEAAAEYDRQNRFTGKPPKKPAVAEKDAPKTAKVKKTK